MRQATLAALALLLLCCSCGGRATHSAGTNQPAVPIQLTGFGLSDLPAVPQHDTFNPQRVTASATASVLGYAPVDTASTTINGTSLELDAPASKVAYGVYDFAATPGEVVTQLSFTGSGPEVYAGISNYVTGKWDFFQPQSGASAYTLSNTAGQYVSPNGHIYIIAATFNSKSYTLDQVNLVCSARFKVSGTVVDGQGNPIQGAVVGTPLGQQAALTDAAGNYNLALPAGNWPVQVTDDSWTFYNNPTAVTVTNADVSNVSFRGFQHGSHFLPNETGPYNDNFSSAEAVDFSSGPLSATLSRVDDSSDYYSFSVAAPGKYYLEFTNPSMDIFFPYLTLYSGQGTYLINSSSVARGTVRIPVLVGQAQQTFAIGISCSGGGGSYSLGFGSGALERLGGSTMPAIHDCLITAHNEVNGEDTEYTASYGFYEDDYRAPVSTTVSVNGDGLSFAPLSTTVDLSAGSQMNVNFTGTPVVLTDSMEPNDTQVGADANAVLALNYNSVTAGDTLTVNSQTDPVDYYSLTLPAGKGLRIRVNYVRDDGHSNPLYSAIYDNLLNFTGSDVGYDDQGTELRLQVASSASTYYVGVGAPGAPDERTYQYTLAVEVYDPVQLDYSATFGAQPLQNAYIYTRTDGGLIFGTSITDMTGAARGLLCKSGEKILSEIFRFGMNIDRNTQETVIGANPVTVTFAADPALSADSGEFDDSPFGLPPAVALPLTVSAALNPDTDYSDCFKVTTTDATPIRLTFLDSTSSHRYPVQLYDSGANPLGGGISVDPAKGPVYLATNGAGDYIVQVTYPQEPTLYTLQIDTAPAFLLGGTVLSGGNPVPNSLVYCTELDRYVYCDFGTGAYSFGALPAGSYTLKAIRGGYSPDQPTKQGVITNADATVNFTMSASNIDQNEPGDNAMLGATGPLVSGVLSSARTIGDTLDSDDWYKFNANAGQLVSIQTITGYNFLIPASFNIFDSGMNYIGQGLGFNADRSLYTFVAPANDTYFIDVNGGPVDYKIQVDVN